MIPFWSFSGCRSSGYKDNLDPTRWVFGSYQGMITFAPTFTKTNPNVYKKFALVAAMAAFVVACGPSQAEIEAKAKATADSLAAIATADSIRMAEEAAAAAAEAEAAAAAAAQAAADSAAAAAAAAKPGKK
jgi:hypothetical protein